MVLPYRPFASRTTISLQELEDQPIVLREHGSYTRDLFMAAVETAGPPPRIAFEVATRKAVHRRLTMGHVLNGGAPQTRALRWIPIEHRALIADDYLVCHADALNYGSVSRFMMANEQPDPV